MLPRALLDWGALTSDPIVFQCSPADLERTIYGTIEGKSRHHHRRGTRLGEAHVRRFVAEGAKVVFTDVEVAAGQAVAAELGGSAMFLRQDVTDAAAWDDVVAHAESAFGPVTVLVNNAGISGPNAFTTDLAVKDFLAVMNVNVNGNVLRHARRHSRNAQGRRRIDREHFICGGIQPYPTSAHLAYTGSKFAVRGLTKAAAVEYASHNIRVNAVAPGGVLTPMAATITPKPVIDAFALRPLWAGLASRTKYRTLFCSWHPTKPPT